MYYLGFENCIFCVGFIKVDGVVVLGKFGKLGNVFGVEGVGEFVGVVECYFWYVVYWFGGNIKVFLFVRLGLL